MRTLSISNYFLTALSARNELLASFHLSEFVVAIGVLE
jgi:hypothetical protein